MVGRLGFFQFSIFALSMSLSNIFIFVFMSHYMRFEIRVQEGNGIEEYSKEEPNLGGN